MSKHDRIEGAFQQLRARLDTSPVVKREKDVITVKNEAFNYMQMQTIIAVSREYNLTVAVITTFKAPHPQIVITLCDVSEHQTKGEKQKDWEQHSFGLTL